MRYRVRCHDPRNKGTWVHTFASREEAEAFAYAHMRRLYARPCRVEEVPEPEHHDYTTREGVARANVAHLEDES